MCDFALLLLCSCHCQPFYKSHYRFLLLKFARASPTHPTFLCSPTRTGISYVFHSQYLSRFRVLVLTVRAPPNSSFFCSSFAFWSRSCVSARVDHARKAPAFRLLRYFFGIVVPSFFLCFSFLSIFPVGKRREIRPSLFLRLPSARGVRVAETRYLSIFVRVLG